MIGLLIVVFAFYWLLLGGFRRKPVEKVILLTLIISGYIYYLYGQGATTEQVLEILFTF